MTKYLIILILFAFVGYGLIKAWPLISGPSLSVNFPQNGATITDGIATVEGTAMRAAQLTLDGAPLLHEENGDFSTTLTFPRGSSILTFVAADRFGRTVTATRTIFVP
jgi:uncharacterized protein YfaP (DUF2135 family)